MKQEMHVAMQFCKTFIQLLAKNDDGFWDNKEEMAHTDSAVAHSTMCVVLALVFAL